MKATFMLTTQRQNCNLRNARVLGLQDPKKHYSKKEIEDDAHLFLLPKGIVPQEFVPLGLTVSVDFYCDVLRSLREKVRRKMPHKWQNQNLIIHHDNAPAHRSFNVSQFLAINNIAVIPYPP